MDALGGGHSELNWMYIVRGLVVVVPCLTVAWAVQKQSKVIAAFAQLNGVQEAQHTEDLPLGEPSGVRSVKTLTRMAIAADRNWFILGVSNLTFTTYLLGAWPPLYYLYFTPKVLCLTLLRLVKFYKKKQHFLLWDFCYWANMLCIFYCWVKPQSPAIFRTAFICANGPLAFSVLAFNHAMIFHSYAHITSVVIHTSPLVLTYGLRWYAAPVGRGMGADHFRVCEVSDCSDATFMNLLFDGLVRFYLWWLVLYYVWIFVALGKYIEKQGYQTLWDRILVMKPIGPVLNRLLKRFPKLLVQMVYLLIHLCFSIVTMLVAVVLFHSQLAHFLFMIAIVLVTIKNAATFYFDVFEGQYNAFVHAAGPAAGSETVLNKKLVGTSTLAEIKQPLLKT